MIDDTFAEVKSEGQTLEIDKAFERLETKEDKPASESQTEKKETDKPSQKGENTPAVKPEPFHKHPRWIQQQKDLKDTRDKLAKLEAERTQNQTVSLPDWWKKQYGDTDESKQRYQAVIQKDGELDWIKSQIKEELQKDSQSEQSQIKDGEEYVNTQLAEMTDEGLKFERNALLKFMVDFQSEFGPGALLDSDGNYDFRKSLALMEKVQPKVEDKTPDLKKQLASQGRARGGQLNQTQVPALSRAALRGKGGWRDALK